MKIVVKMYKKVRSVRPFINNFGKATTYKIAIIFAPKLKTYSKYHNGTNKKLK